MSKKEGETLKNKLKGTGRTMQEIADILGMTRQNLSYHLRKEKLDEDFRRLLNEKGKYIFHVEQLSSEQPNNTLVELAQAIIRQSIAIEKHAETIISQQHTIRFLTERPPDINANVKEA